MATGAEILSYRGNSGLGSNSDIPAIGTKDLEVVNNTLDRLQAQNSMRNQQIFQQRIKDRDALLAELDSGAIKVGDVLEQDVPTVKEGLQKLDDAYFYRIKKGVNDIDAAREYNKAKREAQDRVTQAQARKLGYDTLNGEIAKETLPRKQEAMKAHLDKTINGGFWKDLTPYQQTQDLDVAGSILSTAATEKQQYTDKNNPLLKGTRTLFDYDKTFLNNKDNFLNDANKRYDQQQLVGAIQSLPPQEFLDTMQAVNNRIKEYNDLKGLTPGSQGFVKDVQFAINPNTGQAIINENVPDFAAKYTLAHQKPFSSAETELDKGALELAKLKQDQAELASLDRYRKGQLAIDRDRLSFDKDKAKKAGVPSDIANSAKEYAVQLFNKLTGLADAKGNISAENMKKLTSEELKYLGKAETTENKFSLTALGGDGTISSMRVTPEGMLEVTSVEGIGKDAVTNTIVVDPKQVAGNKLGDEMTLTTGKEGINYNTLISLYGDNKPKQSSDANIPSHTMAEWKSAGWTDDQIKQATKAGKIKVN